MSPGEPLIVLHAMQVKPIAGCDWKWFYQQLQSLHTAGDGLISRPACSPSCSPTGRLSLRPPRYGTGELLQAHYCQAAQLGSLHAACGCLIRQAPDEHGCDHGMAVDLVRCR